MATDPSELTEATPAIYPANCARGADTNAESVVRSLDEVRFRFSGTYRPPSGFKISEVRDGYVYVRPE